MCSGCLDGSDLTVRPARKAFQRVAIGMAGLALLLLPAIASPRELRVCADPNNMPFSNAAGQGFENRIAEIIATDLGAKLTYTWWAQRRGFIRNTLKAGLCDLVPGTPANLEMLRTTTPYYRSSYVFVTRQDGPDVASFNDPRLQELRIGVQLIGDDGANSPPVQALGRRGIVGHLIGYPVYGDYSAPNPPARIVEAVANGEIDLAVVWGPLAGYFAERQKVSLRITPVTPRIDGPQLPLMYDISMGVRREDDALRGDVNSALARHKAEIDAVLAQYGVPRLDMAGSPAR
ncbi:quinoprotein dehydrogenase-associated putative ABC transporter substrate-binding protein [Mesorhizobium sp. M7A.F.Ca.CA.001.07.2.1]|uniref:substrate-binding domain-containing protein n=2 Tax=Phyllobacteriaceae TaxID=69277 RepID=UPI000FCCD046|nr:MULTISPECIES: substrate-binding domain-containing protein [unclassified Mesorhizobium]RUX82023.1 quinoprotein dehydrogenase-associated putative ABC transporter substrate-binding protein [Mesorhizobium sp. M7A.F.Ca.CA.004.08.2.1]RUX85614.1 quinoprotein dehydrogenase-associated putative ABC transporter substrate-binding protein [Mesorhizobium sp. M7A.F.Ca.CA.004.08.1.1]RUY32642.1 quinoprotein dehydrogenase-associated putative ABC transporter substrate-binding protein [Mesorhizobium sp. M7A.F.Ca